MDEDRFDAVARRVSDGTPGGPAYRIGKRGLKVIEEFAARGVAEATMAKALRMGKDVRRIKAAVAGDVEMERAWINGDWAISRGAMLGDVWDPAVHAVLSRPDRRVSGRGSHLVGAGRPDR